MEYLKINFLENAPNLPTEFRTKNWVEINDYVERGTIIAKLNLKLQC